jgi:hypothetical protein
LISIQVSFQRIHAASLWRLVANRTAGQFKKNVLEIGENRAEFSDPDPVLGQTVDHQGHEIVTQTANREPQVAAATIAGMLRWLWESVPDRKCYSAWRSRSSADC